MWDSTPSCPTSGVPPCLKQQCRGPTQHRRPEKAAYSWDVALAPNPCLLVRLLARDRAVMALGSLQSPLHASPQWKPGQGTGTGTKGMWAPSSLPSLHLHGTPPPTTSPLMPSLFGSIVSSLSVHLIGSVGPSGYETEGSTADNGLGGGGPGASTEPERPWPGRGEGSEKRGLKPDRGPRAGQGRAGQV